MASAEMGRANIRGVSAEDRVFRGLQKIVIKCDFLQFRRLTGTRVIFGFWTNSGVVARTTAMRLRAPRT
jgi:hypothetical protein